MPKYKVPDGMIKACCLAKSSEYQVASILQEAIRWQSENPPVPTEDQLHELKYGSVRYSGSEWVSIMYLEPEVPSVGECVCVPAGGTLNISGSVYVKNDSDGPIYISNAPQAPQPAKPEVPDAVKDLLVDSQAHLAVNSDTFNESILEAYRRGRESK